jgi:AGZA family xanthine/uracil permease-like MFS transporter
MTCPQKFKYQWLSSGDIGAAATIIFDNLTILVLISLILQFGYHFPLDIILRNIIPGTVFGVLVGNLLCLWLSFRLAKREFRNVTAIPLGLDAPSAIGFAVCIIGPVFSLFIQQGIGSHQAGSMAWQIGVGCIFILGLIKLFCSLFVERIKKVIPQAALLGAIGGVAIAFLCIFPLVSILRVPTVGLVTLGIVFLTQFAKVRLPFNISGIPAAIIVGTILYYLLIPLGLSGGMPNLSFNLEFLLPKPSLGFFTMYHDIIKYIPLVIPFALLVVFGTMSVAEGAVCTGDNYKVRDLLLVDSIATIAASLCGGIAQTTPYAGFIAYKKMNARAGFLAINIVVVGIGGILGLVGFIVNLVPESAVAPVLLYVGFEIAMQGFVQCEKKYIAPILFSILPSLARLLQLKLTDGSLIDTAIQQKNMFTNVAPAISDHLVITMMGNGFIITGMLWASMLCFAIDKRFLASGVCCLILGVLSYFGVIHSLFINGQMYLPSMLPSTVNMIPLELMLGYFAIGIMVLLSARSSIK